MGSRDYASSFDFWLGRDGLWEKKEIIRVLRKSRRIEEKRKKLIWLNKIIMWNSFAILYMP